MKRFTGLVCVRAVLVYMRAVARAYEVLFGRSVLLVTDFLFLTSSPCFVRFLLSVMFLYGTLFVVTPTTVP